MASFTTLDSHAELTLQQHTEIFEEITHGQADLEGEPQLEIMAQAVPNPPGERRRVKVYELRNNDWFDRGTGFCSASVSYIIHESRCAKSAQMELGDSSQRGLTDILR